MISVLQICLEFYSLFLFFCLEQISNFIENQRGEIHYLYTPSLDRNWSLWGVLQYLADILDKSWSAKGIIAKLNPCLSYKMDRGYWLNIYFTKTLTQSTPCEEWSGLGLPKLDWAVVIFSRHHGKISAHTLGPYILAWDNCSRDYWNLLQHI